MRFYRDYSIADFSFCALATLGTTYAAFISSARAGICEEFSHHPELMRDMHEMGLNSENCEHWLERAIVALVGFMFILLVIRVCSMFCCPPSSILIHHVRNSYTSCLLYPTFTLSSLASTLVVLQVVVPLQLTSQPIPIVVRVHHNAFSSFPLLPLWTLMLRWFIPLSHAAPFPVMCRQQLKRSGFRPQLLSTATVITDIVHERRVELKRAGFAYPSGQTKVCCLRIMTASLSRCRLYQSSPPSPLSYC